MNINEQIDLINKKVNINNVIFSYIQPKGSIEAGSNLCNCPFCNTEDMFVVNEHRNKFRCFACNEEGDVTDFVSKYCNMLKEDACKVICEKETILFDLSRSEKELDMIKANNISALYYYNLLKGNAEARDYLYQRGVNDSMIRKFGIGYASNKGNDLINMLKNRGFSENTLLEVGLISKNSKSGNSYDKFTERIIFPIFDEKNDVVGFSGRLYRKDDFRDSKYFNSPQSPIFTKSNVLYGINYAIKSDKKAWMLCEGQMDVITSHQFGYDSTVASSGTSLTTEQARKIGHYTNNIYLAYDNDDAGIKAKLRAIPMLRKEGLRVKVLDLSPCKDPDEFLKKYGKEQYNNRIMNAISGYDYEIKEWAKDNDNFEKIYEKAVMNCCERDIEGYKEAYNRHLMEHTARITEDLVK